VPDFLKHGILDFIEASPMLAKLQQHPRDMGSEFLKLSPLGTKLEPVYLSHGREYRSPFLINNCKQTEARFYQPKTYVNQVGPGQYDVDVQDVANKVTRKKQLQWRRHEPRAPGVGKSRRLTCQAAPKFTADTVFMGYPLQLPSKVEEKSLISIHELKQL
jgi:hypothetical protein